MAQNPIPGLVLPAINSPLITDKNVSNALQAIQTWAKSVSPRALFAGRPLWVASSGVLPPTPPSDAFLTGWDTPLVTFTTGTAPVTFPVAFQNGIMYIGPTNVQGGSDVYSISSPSGSGFTLHSSAGGTRSEQISYEVVGW